MIEKISSYNLFNFLFPGFLFLIILGKFNNINILNENLIIILPISYFIGMSISRIGSLIVEPILINFKVIPKRNYHEFGIKSSNDKKLEILSEVNNTYRTILAMCLIFIAAMIYIKIAEHFKIENSFTFYLILILTSFLYLFSFIKQSKIINERMNSDSNKI